MESLLHDLRFAWRSFIKSRGLAAIVVFTLALGIAANSVIFSGVSALLLGALPYRDAGQLVVLAEATGQHSRMSVSLPNFYDWRDQNQVFEEIGAYLATSFNLTGDEQPERIQGAQVTSGVLAALGVEPVRGRLISAAEDSPGGERVALVSQALWQRSFGVEEELSDASLKLDGESFRVIGIMPPELQFPDPETELWVPLEVFADDQRRGRGYHGGTYVVARMREGVSLKLARAEMSTIAQRLEVEYPDSNRGHRIRIESLRDRQVGDTSAFLLLLMAAVALVLLIACVGVSNLLFVRATSRQTEVALRSALGASPRRVVRQLLTESTLLAMIGGALGLLLAYWGLRLVVLYLPADLPQRASLGIDGWVLGFTVGVSLLAGIGSGLAPAVRVARPELTRTLMEMATGAGLGRRKRSLHDALVVLTLASALVLLSGAGLMIKSILRLAEVDPGFDPKGALTMRIDLPETKYPTPQQWEGFFPRLLERVGTLPEVVSAGIVNDLPLASGGTEAGVAAGGAQVGEEKPLALIQVVSGGYFESMGIGLIQGRYLTADDLRTSTPVAVIDETMARRFWPDGDAIGKRVSFETAGGRGNPQPRWREVVGVVRHVRFYQLDQMSRVEVYVPYTQPPPWFESARRPMSLVLRSSGDPRNLISAVRREVRALDPDQPVFRVATMEEIVEQQVQGRRLVAKLLAIFALLGSIMAMVEIYSVISYSVTQRAHEIGVRMALGARSREVLQMALRHGLKLTFAGLAIGIVASLGLRQALSWALYGVSAFDPLILILLPLLLGSVAFLAAYIPARRSTRVDPSIALRYE